MKFIDEFRDRELVQRLSRAIASLAPGPATLMEVCGTHTMAVARFGLKSLLPPGVKLISGPGCPVCVTDQSDMDAFLALGTLPRAILVSFGDMVRVPGIDTSLEQACGPRDVAGAGGLRPPGRRGPGPGNPGQAPGFFRGGL